MVVTSHTLILSLLVRRWIYFNYSDNDVLPFFVFFAKTNWFDPHVYVIFFFLVFVVWSFRQCSSNEFSYKDSHFLNDRIIHKSLEAIKIMICFFIAKQ